MKAFEFTTSFKANIPTKLGLFSDIHWDSPDCDKETLMQHLNYCRLDGRYILINGDFFDAILLGDKKRATPSVIEHKDNQLNVKINEAYEFLKPYQKNILFIGAVDHTRQGNFSIALHILLRIISKICPSFNIGGKKFHLFIDFSYMTYII